jgi:hypothetical protein
MSVWLNLSNSTTEPAGGQFSPLVATAMLAVILRSILRGWVPVLVGTPMDDWSLGVVEDHTQ